MAEATTLTLAGFLLARIAEDESVAHEHGSGKWRFNPGSTFLQHYTPTRVLAECEAKRQIIARVARCEALVGRHPHAARELAALQPVLRDLAVPYVDHPHYREEWRL